MAGQSTYILISEIPPGLTQEERENGFDGLRGMGMQNSVYPNENNHSIVSLDGSQILLEANFSVEELEESAVVDVLANASGIPPGLMSGKITYRVFADAEECRNWKNQNLGDWEEAIS